MANGKGHPIYNRGPTDIEDCQPIKTGGPPQPIEDKHALRNKRATPKARGVGERMNLYERILFVVAGVVLAGVVVGLVFGIAWLLA